MAIPEGTPERFSFTGKGWAAFVMAIWGPAVVTTGFLITLKVDVALTKQVGESNNGQLVALSARVEDLIGVKERLNAQEQRIARLESKN